MERKPLPDWCVVGGPAALLIHDSATRATLVTITKVNKVSVTVTDKQGGATVVSVARGLTLNTAGSWMRSTDLVRDDDPRVLLAMAVRSRALTAQVVQEALADWAKHGDDVILQGAIERLQRHVKVATPAAG